MEMDPTRWGIVLPHWRSTGLTFDVAQDPIDGLKSLSPSTWVASWWPRVIFVDNDVGDIAWRHHCC